MSKKNGIYLIANIANNKVYIGQSTQLPTRLIQHRSDLKYNRHHNQHLQNSYNKYDIGAFCMGIIRYCPKEQLDFWERYYIRLFDSDNPNKGYNKEGGGHKKKNVPLETRKRISKSLKGHDVSLETRKKISESQKGHDVSLETRKKMSESLKGPNNPNFGKTLSLEERKNVSRSLTVTGFYSVHKINEKKRKQGFTWGYVYKVDNKKKRIKSIDLLKLKNKVKAKGLPWGVIDNEKAQQSLELNAKWHP